jgi:hypothetical protein
MHRRIGVVVLVMLALPGASATAQRLKKEASPAYLPPSHDFDAPCVGT